MNRFRIMEMILWAVFVVSSFADIEMEGVDTLLISSGGWLIVFYFLFFPKLEDVPDFKTSFRSLLLYQRTLRSGGMAILISGLLFKAMNWPLYNMMILIGAALIGVELSRVFVTKSAIHTRYNLLRLIVVLVLGLMLYLIE